MKSFQEKRVVTVFGYKIQLICSAEKEGNEEEKEEEIKEKPEEGDDESWF